MRSQIRQIWQKKLIPIGSISCQTSFASGGAQRSEETALHEAKIFRCLVDGRTIDLLTAISTVCYLGREDLVISPLLTLLSKVA